jgi:serine protease Do
MKMGKKLSYLIIILLLLSQLLGSSGCLLYLPLLPSPATSSPNTDTPSSTSEFLDPSWTIPVIGDSSQLLPDIASVVREVMPSVVSVTTEMTVRDIFQREYTQSGAGSGVIIDDKGYIITNNHVVSGAEKVQVELVDGRIISADIVGVDALTDLAVLKIEAPELSHAMLGDSSRLSVGDWTVAIGNALGEGISATQGIISRLNVSLAIKGNTLSDLIQTTAAINPGNSGGPLLNMAGDIVGITSIKLASIDVESVGYAISINSAEPVITSLIQQGYVSRPWLGVALYTVDSYVAAQYDLAVDEGVLIGEVIANSPADIAGLKEGDVITDFDDNKIKNSDDLFQAINGCDIGQRVKIVFVRNEEINKVVWAQLAESPPPWD